MSMLGDSVKQFALIGHPLGHSLSPALHKMIYRQLEIDDAVYSCVDLEEGGLKRFFTGFRAGGFAGINVTVPHKSNVIPLLDEIDKQAKIINAVNCVHRDNKKLKGYNTDIQGFEYSLQQNSIAIEGKQFAIIGAGGSAQAVGAALAWGNAQSILIINRTAEKAEQLKQTIASINANVSVHVVDEQGLLERAKQLDCVINSSSVGMLPDVASSPLSAALSAEIFSDNVVAYDLVYNPLKTQFLKDAESNGAVIVNGLQMLVAQAVYSIEIWMSGNIVAHLEMNTLLRELEKAIK